MIPPHQARALTRPAATKTPATPWLAITGGKGGVGKTVLAVNVAILAARAGYRTLLADLDPGLANVDVHLRLAPRWTLDDLTRGDCSPAEALVAGPAGVSVLPGRSGSIALADGTMSIASAHAALRRAARGFDLVVVDTGAGIGPAVVETLDHATLALITTTSDPSAATDAYALTKILLQRRAPTPRLVINRARSIDDAARTAGRLSMVTQRFLATPLTLTGWLRNDSGVELSVRNQRPFALHGNGPALEDLRALTATALSELPGLRRRQALRDGSSASEPAARPTLQAPNHAPGAARRPPRAATSKK
ncbi:MAG: AAA family ATPase [Planctomycetota bacterium]